MRKSSSGSARVVFPRFSRDELVDQLRQGVGSLHAELPVKRVVLFGSWAAGRATAYSDIDLLVVYEGPPRDDAFATVRRHVHIRGLEPHVYTEHEANALHDTLARMTRDGIQILPP